LSSIVRVWTGITLPGQEAPKGHAISAASTEVLPQEIRRELRPESDPEALHARPPEGRIIKLHPGLVAMPPQEAASKGEAPGVEASEVPPEVETLEDRPEVASAAADGVEASDIRSNLT
jgi:hypothetical protein